jgi:hypothetical protein
MTEIPALQQAIDETDTDGTDELSDNVAEDIVYVTRGNVIGNEQQTYIIHTGLKTGWMWSSDRQVNTIITGPSAVGKSVSQGGATDMLPMEQAYTATNTSSKGVLDDSSWEESLFAPLDEWQKIPKELTELIKSVSGGADDKYEYVRSKSGSNDSDEREARRIVKKAKPYNFLYAQHALDHELSTRLVFLPIDDDQHIRDAIIRKEAGHTNISVDGHANDYIYKTTTREKALREHYRGLPTEMDDDDNLRGSVDVELPPWVHYAVEPIFDVSRTETNRVASQVYNLIRGATLDNYHVRDTIEKTVDSKELTAYVAEPQDVANVLSCRETLLATTHRLTPQKRMLLDALRAHEGIGESGSDGASGVTLQTIREWLDDKSVVSVPRKDKMRDMLGELENQFYVSIHERAAPDGSSHLYEFESLRDIGVPRIHGLAEHMSDEEIERSRELNHGIDLETPFAEATDPFRDQPFHETVAELRDELTEDAMDVARKQEEAWAQDVTDGEEDNALTAAMGTSGDEGLGAFSEDDDVDVTEELSPTETAVYEQLRAEADGNEFTEDAEEFHLLGVASEPQDLTEIDVTGTLYDPAHELWDRVDKPDEWVSTQSEAEREIEQATKALQQEGILRFDMSGDDSTISVSVAA